MKKFWKENRILLGLFVILIICFIAICSVTISYFMGSNNSIYGNREVEDIKKEEKEEYVGKLKEDEKVIDVIFRQSIRTVYITITFADGTTLIEAQNKAQASLENLSEETLKLYDINFILIKDKTEKDDGFTIMGAFNSNGSGISWNNNTVVEETEEE